MIGLFIAGHSTTAAAATCMLALVGGDPDTAARVRAEVASWPPAERAPGGPLSAERLLGSPLLQAVVDEALRVAPPSIGAFKRATEPVKVGGFDVPAGRMIYTMTDLFHYDPKEYPEPTRFCPMRFLPGAAAQGGAGAAAAPATMAFGAGGMHSCLGEALARAQLAALLAVAHRDFSYRLDPESDSSITFVVGLGALPRDGCKVFVGEPRLQ